MKLNISATFFTLFLLSATLTVSTQDFIYDTDGSPIQNGGEYYVMPILYGFGGVTFGATGNEICPVSVVLSTDEHSRGSTVRISSPVRFQSILEGLNLDMTFTSPIPVCAPAHSKWGVVKGPQDELPSIKIVGIDDESVVPGWFTVEKRRGRHSDVNLVKFCADRRERCDDVFVRVDENGVNSLVVGSYSSSTDDDLLELEKKKKKNEFAVRFIRARRHHLLRHGGGGADDA